MTSLIDYNSVEKEMLTSFFNEVEGIEKWIISIIENYIFSFENKLIVNPYSKCQYRHIYRQKFDIKDGPFKAYLVNNTQEMLLVESNYKDGELDGEYKYHYTSGNQLMEHCFYINGQKHGEYKYWMNGGQLIHHYFYSNGKKHGECKEYSIYGQLTTHCVYNEGEIDTIHLTK